MSLPGLIRKHGCRGGNPAFANTMSASRVLNLSIWILFLMAKCFLKRACLKPLWSRMGGPPCHGRVYNVMCARTSFSPQSTCTRNTQDVERGKRYARINRLYKTGPKAAEQRGSAFLTYFSLGCTMMPSWVNTYFRLRCSNCSLSPCRSSRYGPSELLSQPRKTNSLTPLTSTLSEVLPRLGARLVLVRVPTTGSQISRKSSYPRVAALHCPGRHRLRRHSMPSLLAGFLHPVRNEHQHRFLLVVVPIGILKMLNFTGGGSVGGCNLNKQ